jgi:hypothetical protein
MKSYSSLKNRLLKDKEVGAHYDKLGPEFALVEAVTEKRLTLGLTQNTSVLGET